MSRPTIIINDLDAERIDRLLEQPAYADLPIADALNAEPIARKCVRHKRCRTMSSP